MVWLNHSLSKIKKIAHKILWLEKLILNFKRKINRRKKVFYGDILGLFKNKNGYVSDETNWELILIPGNAHYYYEAKSLNDKGEKYTIRCKSVK